MSVLAAVVELAANATLQSGRDPVVIADRACTFGVAGPMTARCLLLAARQVLDAAPHRARSWAEAARGNAAPADLAALRALVAFRQGNVDETIAAVDEFLRIEPRWARVAIGDVDGARRALDAEAEEPAAP